MLNTIVLLVGLTTIVVNISLMRKLRRQSRELTMAMANVRALAAAQRRARSHQREPVR
jgi:hypothetical protein